MPGVLSTWESKGEKYSYQQIAELAEKTEPFKNFIDVDDSMFFKPGNMPKKVQEWCVKHGQVKPKDKGEIVRCVLESIALKYREVIEKLTFEVVAEVKK